MLEVDFKTAIPLVKKEDTFSIAELYHENSKVFDFFINLKEKCTTQKMRDDYDRNLQNVYKLVSKSFKRYPNPVKIEMPKDLSLGNVSIERILQARRSQRDFLDEPLSLDELSKLLHFSYGINGHNPVPFDDGICQSFRFSPSAGALYPLEIYPVLFNVEGTKKGIYHYHVRDHILEFIKEGDFQEKLYEYTLRQDLIKKANAVFAIAAVFERHKFKYGERGYRYTLFDAGHLVQNIYIVSTALHLGCCSIGGFIDDKVNEILNIDGINETAIYMVAIGKISQSSQAKSADMVLT